MEMRPTSRPPSGAAAAGKGRTPGPEDEYRMMELLGTGGHGTVHKAMNKNTGVAVAIKKVPLPKSKDQLDMMMSEIQLLSYLEHPNIVRYAGSFNANNHLHIILEFVEGGSLQGLVKRWGVFPEDLCGLFLGQVLDGLEYLHAEGTIHRDIKGANILIDKNSNVKLADFGVATSKHTHKDADPEADPEVVGTAYWMAPEVVQQKPQTERSDIWSVGCTLLELLTGDPPYAELAPIPALFKISDCTDPPPFPPDLSNECRSFLSECFQRDPQRRFSATQAKNHPYIQTTKRKDENFDYASVQNTIRVHKSKPVVPSPNPNGAGPRNNSAGNDSPRSNETANNQDQDTDKTEATTDMTENTEKRERRRLRRAREKHAREIAEAELYETSDFARLGSAVTVAPEIQSAVQAYMEEEHGRFEDLFDTSQRTAGSTWVADKLADTLGAKTTWQSQPLVHVAAALQDSVKQAVSSKVSTSQRANEATREQITKHLSMLQEESTDHDVVEACTGLITIFKSSPSFGTQLISLGGVMPLVDMLQERAKSEQVSIAVLRLINQLLASRRISNVYPLLENLCVLGLIREIQQILSAQSTASISLCVEAAQAMSKIARFPSTLRSFVTAGGVSTLARLLAMGCTVSDNHQRPMIFSAVDAVWNIIHMLHTSTSRTNLCWLLVKQQMLPSLTKALRIVSKDSNKLDYSYKWTMLPLALEAGQLQKADHAICHHKIAEIMVAVAKGDAGLKQKLAHVALLHDMLEVLPRAEQVTAAKMLAVFKHLSTDPEVSSEPLQLAGAIPKLVSMVTKSASKTKSRSTIPLAASISNEVVSTLYNLCLDNKTRQEQAAVSGCIPHLMALVDQKTPSHILGLPLLCSFTTSSKRSRVELYRHDGVSFFIELLNVLPPKWQVRVLEALKDCVVNDGPGVEKIMCEEQNIAVLVSVFAGCPLGSQHFLDPLMEMLADRNLKHLNQTLGESSLVQSVKIRLQGKERDPHCRLKLIKILKSLYEGHRNAKVIISQFSLYGLVEGLAKNENAILVKQIATELLCAFNVQRLL